jgi:uncharacterized membrane protein YcaP (DUF421 family)
VQEILEQAGLALVYYAVLVAIMRLAGKRLAGQTTTFDLVVLIQMAVVVQTTALRDGKLNATVFVATVFVAHRLLASACVRWPAVRMLVRGKPRPLVRDGVVLDRALAEESMSRDELMAGLRKLGFASPDDVGLAVLEETGHVSAIGRR